MKNDPSPRSNQRSPFSHGEKALLYDRRNRRYVVVLETGSRFFTHIGAISHDQIIGRLGGFYVQTDSGHRFFVVKPTLQESIFELPRESQVIYPKDIGAIIMKADLFPGAHVIEIGMGSGALSAATLRAIGPQGSLVSYDVRESILAGAQANIRELALEVTNHKVTIQDTYVDGINELEIDRILIDVPEPWRLVEAAAAALLPGGILMAYMPTVLQAHQFAMTITSDLRWRLAETTELIERSWHFANTSARPNHRMVAHTGFISTARRAEPIPTPG